MRVFPTIYPIRHGVTCRRLYFYLNNLQRGDSAAEFDGSLDAAAGGDGGYPTDNCTNFCITPTSSSIVILVLAYYDVWLLLALGPPNEQLQIDRIIHSLSFSHPPSTPG